MTELAAGAIRKVDSHEWEREKHEHYVEPNWCASRLFDVEDFAPGIWDPCCGFGTIPKAAIAHGLWSVGEDIVDRGAIDFNGTQDFLNVEIGCIPNIVCNPPFDKFKEFALHALDLGSDKVAMIWLVRTLPAARWLAQTPLKTIYLLTPRPSMPPGHVIASGEKPGGGKQDFCWLVWQRGYFGTPRVQWLHRDGARS